MQNDEGPCILPCGALKWHGAGLNSEFESKHMDSFLVDRSQTVSL